MRIRRVTVHGAARGLRTVNDVLALTLTLAKLGADYRRHATHAVHSKRCDCLAYCTPCIAETLRREKPAKQDTS